MAFPVQFLRILTPQGPQQEHVIFSYEIRQFFNGRMIIRNLGTKMFGCQHPNIKSLQI